MKKTIGVAALILGLTTALPAAQAGGVDLSIGIGVPGVVFGGPPVYYAPPPPPPRVVVVPDPVYAPGVPYYYDRHAYKHAEKRWRKEQKRAWKEYRRGYYGYGGDDDD
ncbi:MAG TPA: hypothetical protein VF285_08160 [Castellaniella sp.]|uniref:hypothetical protein n=1 Tax=Castellaniella sp. TaxID=1955812 RepID=UPI002EFA98D6